MMQNKKIPFLIFLAFTLIQLLFISKYPIPISINEAEIFLFAKNINIDNIFPIPIIFTIPFAFFNNTLYLLRIPHFLAGFILFYLNYFVVGKFIFPFLKVRFLHYLIPLFLVFIPWMQALILFHLPETLTLIFLLTSIIFSENIIKKGDNFYAFILYFLSLFLAILTSWTGIIFSIFFPFFTFLVTKKANKRKIIIFSLIFYSVIGLNLYKNLSVSKKFFLEKTFINQITPKRLAEEINERQKADYLASNKQFILPLFIRKFIYNKPFSLFDKTLKKSVSIVDFEQLSFPLISYNIISLSGLLPKGNLPLLYFWEIIFIILGLYSSIKKEYKILLILLLSTLPPVIFLEKRNLLTSGFTLIPYIIFLEILGFYLLIKWAARLSNKITVLVLISFFLILPFSLYEQYKLIYKDIFSYQTSDLYLFREISSQIKEKYDRYTKIIVTDRFGPTNLMSEFYLNNNSDMLEKIEFRAIIFPQEEVVSDYLYIGLPGEFTKPTENSKDIPLTKNLTLIDEISAPDELVYHYGENVWVVEGK